jgi:hypothetical protein
MAVVKNKTNYKVYEYIYSNELFGDVIILAHTEKNKVGEIWLNVWCRSQENMGLMHFIISYPIDNDSELLIRKEVESMADSGYFDDFIDSAMDDEAILEEVFIIEMESANDGEDKD